MKNRGEQLFINVEEKKKKDHAPNYNGVAYGKLMPPYVKI